MMDRNEPNVRRGSLVLKRLGNRSAWVEADSAEDRIGSHDHYNVFRQGADLMPRTALFVEVLNDNPAQRVITVQTSSVEVANPDGKVLKGQCFRGQVNRRYLFSTVTSNMLLPFTLCEDKGLTIVLPAQFLDTRPTVMSTSELVDQGDATTSAWFEAVDTAIRADDSTGDADIRTRIDVRGKLSKQEFRVARFLVHYGASGATLCAAIQIREPETDRPFIADQTTYVAAIDDEDEAYYLVGMLNSSVLTELISDFQPEGGFGKRHIHKLPVDFIPPYDQENVLHQRVVALARETTQAAQAVRDAKPRVFCNMAIPVRVRRPIMRQAISAQLKALDEGVWAALNS